MKDKTIRREFRAVHSEIRSLKQQLWGIVERGYDGIVR